jgi:hypothetical protein
MSPRARSGVQSVTDWMLDQVRHDKFIESLTILNKKSRLIRNRDLYSNHFNAVVKN